MNHRVTSRPMGAASAPRDNTSPNAIALTFWVALWVLNGATTALPFALIGQTGVWLGVGICIHLVISLIETRLWRSLRRCSPGERLAIGSEILIVGVVDVLTSSLSFLYFFTFLGLATPSVPWYAICTVLAETIAIGAELMIRLHWRLMRA